jgi:hypothetical protein
VVSSDGTKEQEHPPTAAVFTEALARGVLAAGRDLILLCDETHRLTFVGPDADAVFGRVPAPGEDLLALVQVEDRAALADALGRPGRRVTTCHLAATGGTRRTVELTTVAQPDLAGTVCAVRDITDRQEITDRLTHDASHDGLTSLANRTHLLAQLDAALERRTPVPGQPHLAVLYLDLDGFKRINDTFGHAAARATRWPGSGATSSSSWPTGWPGRATRRRSPGASGMPSASPSWPPAAGWP